MTMLAAAKTTTLRCLLTKEVAMVVIIPILYVFLAFLVKDMVDIDTKLVFTGLFVIAWCIADSARYIVGHVDKVFSLICKARIASTIKQVTEEDE